ncbi:DUF4440 domain-containing protein [Sphingomonas bacterium]|uniref:DUF4440 domain-containing protein n=1 Tax=Sphingomonas bacterium TaxID=1895847 RepID=UPI001576BC26|nr:nuclear transport factor 2 family protein [Sphingomonas bacterium]
MILALLAPILLGTAAQHIDRSTDRLPHADPLPLADDDAGPPLAAAQRLLAAIATRDGAAVLAAVHPDGSATSVSDRGVDRRDWTAFAARFRPGPERYEERLTDPAVDVEGAVASVWSPYQFRIDGRLDHCGTDHFDLVREGGGWRVLNVTWTTRTCGDR